MKFNIQNNRLYKYKDVINKYGVFLIDDITEKTICYIKSDEIILVLQIVDEHPRGNIYKILYKNTIGTILVYNDPDILELIE